MAEETTQDQEVESALEEQATSSSVIFSEDELADLEREFSGDESAQDEGEETDDEEGDESIDEEESEDEDEESSESADGDEGSEEAEEDDDEEGEEGPEFVLTVEGEEYEVNDVDDLARLAQKGIFYEKRDAQTQQALNSANFTMQAMINDHFGFLEEFYAQQFGDHESARTHVAKLAHNYLVPYYKEMQSEPEQQQLMREKRQLEREKRNMGRNQNGQVTFTQEEVQELHNLEMNITSALGEVGLPKDSAPLRKRMADIMLGALEHNQNLHPVQAAKILLKEREQLHAELTRTLPSGGRRRQKTPAQRERDIAATRQRRSRKKPGNAQGKPPRQRQPARTFTGRQFLDELDNALNLDRYE